MNPGDSDDQRVSGDALEVQVPAEFLTSLLPQMTDVSEIQVCFAYFRLTRLNDKVFSPVEEGRFLADMPLQQALRARGSIQEPSRHICKGLELAVSREVLLRRSVNTPGGNVRWYFYSNPETRRYIDDLEHGLAALPGDIAPDPSAVGIERDPANVFREYEQRVGAMTPLVADRLIQALDMYPGHWINEAMGIAADKNRRSWRYVESILVAWQSSGKSLTQVEEQTHETHRRNDQQPLGTGEYGDGRHLRRARRISMPDL